MTYAYIGLGSNKGNSRRLMHTAARLLHKLPGVRLSAMSPLYSSMPLGCPGAQKQYINAVAELQTTLPPQRVFCRLRQIEKNIQKKPRAQNTARRLDVDYLAHGSCRRRQAVLQLPHPRLYQRAFVLKPLRDILGKSKSRTFNRAAVEQALYYCRRQKLWQLS